MEKSYQESGQQCFNNKRLVKMEEKAAINAAQTITRYYITSITKTEFEIERADYSRPVGLFWRNCFSGHAYVKVVY